MNITEITTWGKNELALFSSTPLLDVQIILEHFLGYTKAEQIIKEKIIIKPLIVSKIKQAIKKRKNYWPIAYIIGYKDFYQYRFMVNQHTLVPRPETEELVDYAIKLIEKYNLKTVLDIGTGSGCIAITMKKILPFLQVWASDLSVTALKVAKYNAKKWQVVINWQLSNLLASFNKKQTWDLIIANLPYVANNINNLSIKHEPASALFSGTDGLDHYRRLAKQIKPGISKHLIIEIDDKQAKHIKNIFGLAQSVEIIKDFSGKNRIAHIVYG